MLTCEECTCDRPKLVLLEDPPRPNGRANYAYVRVLRFGLSLANEEWRKEHGMILRRNPYRPQQLELWLRTPNDERNIA